MSKDGVCAIAASMHLRLTMVNTLMMAILVAIVCMASSGAWAHASHARSAAHQTVETGAPATVSRNLVEIRSYRPAIESHSHFLGDAGCAGLNCCGSCSVSIHIFAADPYIAAPIRRAFRMLPDQAKRIVGITPDDPNRPPQTFA